MISESRRNVALADTKGRSGPVRGRGRLNEQGRAPRSTLTGAIEPSVRRTRTTRLSIAPAGMERVRVAPPPQRAPPVTVSRSGGRGSVPVRVEARAGRPAVTGSRDMGACEAPRGQGGAGGSARGTSSSILDTGCPAGVRRTCERVTWKSLVPSSVLRPVRQGTGTDVPGGARGIARRPDRRRDGCEAAPGDVQPIANSHAQPFRLRGRPHHRRSVQRQSPRP